MPRLWAHFKRKCGCHLPAESEIGRLGVRETAEGEGRDDWPIAQSYNSSYEQQVSLLEDATALRQAKTFTWTHSDSKSQMAAGMPSN